MNKATILKRFLLSAFALTFMAMQPAIAQDNVIIDGDFPADTLTAGWTTYFAYWDGGPNVTGTAEVIDNEAVISNLSGTASTSWHVQLSQEFTDDQVASLSVGGTYTLTFDARSNEAERPLRVFFGQNEAPNTGIAAESFELGTEMATYSMEFVVDQTFGLMKLSFEIGHDSADFILDNVELIETGEPVPPNPEFGDNKILFVDGPNVLVPRIHGSVVEDPIEEGNLVHRISGGAFFNQGFFWDEGGAGGVDFTQNIADVDTVYLRIRLNPNDHDDAEGNIRSTGELRITDVTNNSNSNLGWGISWQFPADMYDNEWHDLAIPLPKPTIAEHDSALNGVDLNGDPLPADEQYNSEAQERWNFHVAWNGSVNIDPNDPEFGGDPEWENLGRISISLGNDQSGAFYLDDVYVGSESAVDLSVATALPDLPGDVIATSDAGEVTVSWTHNDESNIFNYELYYSGSDIESIENDGVKYIGSFRTSDDLTYSHGVELPHPSVSGVEYYYAVVPTTQYSIKSPTNFTQQNVTATGGTVMPYIFELTEEQELQIISDLENGEINPESWPTDEYEPFVLSDPDIEEADAYSRVWVAFGRAEGFQTMYIYTEANDDDVLGGSESTPGSQTGTTKYPIDPASHNGTWIPGIADIDMGLEWNYYLKDQIKLHFGTYDVDFATGTTNEYRSRGEKPDYFLSLQPKIDPTDESLTPDGLLTRFWVTEHNFDDPDVTYDIHYYNSEHQFTFSSLYENIMDGETRTGWRSAVAFDAGDLLVATEGGEPIDEPFVFPAEDEIKYLPFMIGLWDKDSGDAGNWWEIPSHVLRYPTSIGAGGNNEWEDNLSALGSVAMAGIGVATSNEENANAVPQSFSLEQNYPNPFNPSTKITFNLPNTAEVKLTVFNVLGQRVATLVNNQKMNTGSHTVNFDASALSSGMYIYRLEAGKFISNKKMMLIK